ncbi:DUF2262 domain-containing protein [Heyndrickxia oleronia]|uniref:DUF2262 domain-containing protein n=1 Tax=Heyndrickxia oleronia TaxID=38875 RepID=A0A8E2IEG9_9BACI|nr:DUF2262 domain-containing protein [Heyndrickxia oleronia]NYV67393.1 DUF2262 domain-containing protein [Bacillus sp. Gen3]OJH16671.1 hypothetical protein BLX88_22760 [Bacillus obstructivus]MBU5213801.1 DUF2262 domain-containing protein [Heyndrickxia oleronia]MCM3455234.1 DUF2262 domain-containing protein [Heyndrickxia oleronia]MEC1375060.1 DUF2262 domain-containing protein [Heyndrickxia oleronia]
MSKTREKSQFESRFKEQVMEVIAVTGASGISAGRAGGNQMWNASIPLIAWKALGSNEPSIKEELRLEWLVDDEEWEKTRDLLGMNSIARLQVRKAEKSMMLVSVIEKDYRDDELEIILQESLKPVFYNDDVLGIFELNKGIKVFEKDISWAGEEGYLYFDWNEDRTVMHSALKTAYELFKEQDKWNRKIRGYAAEELVELANEWLEDNEEAEMNKITKEIFVGLMKLSSISVYPDGDFDLFFDDGDMFWGHSIIVTGNINGEFSSAEIAG